MWLTDNFARPASIYALTCGCSLLLLGSVADVVGSRPMYLLGCILQCLFTLACGVSNTGPELIVFRGLSGIAASFCLPSAVSIINSSFPVGRRRNRAFAWMGGGQPIGYSIGLTLGGSIASTVGWQWGFFLASIVNLAVSILASWQLPRNEQNSPTVYWKKLISDVDWLGALIASACLAMLSYVLAYVGHLPVSSARTHFANRVKVGDRHHYQRPCSHQHMFYLACACSHTMLSYVGRPSGTTTSPSADSEHIVA